MPDQSVVESALEGTQRVPSQAHPGGGVKVGGVARPGVSWPSGSGSAGEVTDGGAAFSVPDVLGAGPTVPGAGC